MRISIKGLTHEIFYCICSSYNKLCYKHLPSIWVCACLRTYSNEKNIPRYYCISLLFVIFCGSGLTKWECRYYVLIMRNCRASLWIMNPSQQRVRLRDKWTPMGMDRGKMSEASCPKFHATRDARHFSLCVFICIQMCLILHREQFLIRPFEESSDNRFFSLSSNSMP